MPTCLFELVSCYMYNHSVIVVLFTLLWYQANPQTLLGEKQNKTVTYLVNWQNSQYLTVIYRPTVPFFLLLFLCVTN